MKGYSLTLAFILAISLSGCLSVSARYSFDSTTDFSSFNSYAWAPIGPGTLSTPESTVYFISTMDDALAEKGFNLEPENPDFLIITAQVQTYVEEYASPYGVIDFPKAMVRISFKDPSTGLSIYESAVDAYIDMEGTQKTRNALIDQSVEALLKEFPPDTQ